MGQVLVQDWDDRRDPFPNMTRNTPTESDLQMQDRCRIDLRLEEGGSTEFVRTHLVYI